MRASLVIVRATRPSACAVASLRQLGRRAHALAWLLALGCGSPNARVLEQDQVPAVVAPRPAGDLSEADKIHTLVQRVAAADVTFVRGETVTPAAQVAAELEHRAARLSVPTARQFVDAIAGNDRGKAEPLRVRLADGTVLEAKDWYLGQLAALEGSAPHSSARKHDPNAPVTLGILDALLIVERSNLRFVAPPRKLSSGKTRGKRKEYSSAEFAEMLRKKWEFLGADVRDLETFIQEIASDAFSSMEPYRVVHLDGSEEEFRGWLLAQLDARRQALAKGGAP